MNVLRLTVFTICMFVVSAHAFATKICDVLEDKTLTCAEMGDIGSFTYNNEDGDNNVCDRFITARSPTPQQFNCRYPSRGLTGVIKIDGRGNGSVTYSDGSWMKVTTDKAGNELHRFSSGATLFCKKNVQEGSSECTTKLPN